MLFLCGIGYRRWPIAISHRKEPSDPAIAFSDLSKICLLFVQKGFYSQIHLITIPFLNKFINSNQTFKRDPFHMLIVCNKNVMKWGVVVGHNNWRFAGRTSYLWTNKYTYTFSNRIFIKERKFLI